MNSNKTVKRIQGGVKTKRGFCRKYKCDPEQTIHACYKRKSLVLHPDKGGETSKFQEFKNRFDQSSDYNLPKSVLCKNEIIGSQSPSSESSQKSKSATKKSSKNRSKKSNNEMELATKFEPVDDIKQKIANFTNTKDWASYATSHKTNIRKYSCPPKTVRRDKNKCLPGEIPDRNAQLSRHSCCKSMKELDIFEIISNEFGAFVDFVANGIHIYALTTQKVLIKYSINNKSIIQYDLDNEMDEHSIAQRILILDQNVIVLGNTDEDIGFFVEYDKNINKIRKVECNGELVGCTLWKDYLFTIEDDGTDCFLNLYKDGQYEIRKSARRELARIVINQHHSIVSFEDTIVIATSEIYVWYPDFNKRHGGKMDVIAGHDDTIPFWIVKYKNKLVSLGEDGRKLFQVWGPDFKLEKSKTIRSFNAKTMCVWNNTLVLISGQNTLLFWDIDNWEIPKKCNKTSQKNFKEFAKERGIVSLARASSEHLIVMTNPNNEEEEISYILIIQ